MDARIAGKVEAALDGRTDERLNPNNWHRSLGDPGSGWRSHHRPFLKIFELPVAPPCEYFGHFDPGSPLHTVEQLVDGGMNLTIVVPVDDQIVPCKKVASGANQASQMSGRTDGNAEQLPAALALGANGDFDQY